MGGLPLPLQSSGSPWLPGGGPGFSGGTGVGQTQSVQTSVLGALLGLLGTPANVGVEQPSLEHFDTGTAAGTTALLPTTSSGARGAGAGAAPAVLWGVTLVILLALVGLGIARHHRRRLSRVRAIAAAPLITLAVVMTVAAVQTTVFPPSAARQAAAILVANAGSRSTFTAAPDLASGSVLFNRLVAFESQIASTEALIQSPAAGQGAAQLRQEHQLATSLETTLQQEYNFFAATARDPKQSASLMQAAATVSSRVSAVVSYDLQAVEAQLAQQAAIVQASRNNPIPTGAALAAPGHAATLNWPMGGVVTQGFGPSRVAIEPAVSVAGITYPHFHTGIDIANAFGTPVQAAADGVVALAGSETDEFGHLVGYGNYVVIAHGGNMITLYGHLEKLLVNPGQAVHAGDPIGLEGSSGNSTGPHVHFELRIGGIATDPRAYIQP